MEIIRVDASKGWDWLVAGWKLFTKNPGIWVLMFLIFAVIAVVLQLVPIIGSLIWSVVAPALTAGMLYGAQQVDKNETLEINHLFQGFSDKSRTGPLINLGLISVVATIIFMVVGGASMMSLMGGAITQPDTPLTAMQLSIGSLLGLLIAILFMAGIFTAMIYAVPLVMFTAITPLAALKLSITASLKNWLPLLWLSLLMLPLLFIAAIPMGLGFLVLMPVLFATIYISYRDIFVTTHDPAHDPA